MFHGAFALADRTSMRRPQASAPVLARRYISRYDMRATRRVLEHVHAVQNNVPVSASGLAQGPPIHDAVLAEAGWLPRINAPHTAGQRDSSATSELIMRAAT